MTDEQTNHNFFNGKGTRKKAMLKAKQIQMHKETKTIKNMMGKDGNEHRNQDNNYIIQIVGEANDEINPNVNRHIKNVQ
eukprot:12275869-Heterocapsa_arctica.AAC.1